MRKIQSLIMALSLLMLSSVPLSGQHFVPVYESVYQPMNIIFNAATFDGIDLEAGDEIGIFDTIPSGEQICVGSIVLTGPIIPGNPLPVIACTDDPLTIDQDGFIDGNPILYRLWDDSESMELICVTMTYDLGFDVVFTSLGTALGSLDGIPSPTVDAGADDETCEDTPYTLSGIATNQDYVEWTTDGDGTFDDASLLNATYTPGNGDISNGVVILTLTAYAFSPCGDHASDDMVLVIQALATAYAGADDEICEDMPYTLSGFATNQASVEWTTDGDGTFDDATLLDATYTPGSGDISNGVVILTLTATSIAPCNTDIEDDMVLIIQALPIVGAGPDAGICEGETYTMLGTASNHGSLNWSSAGDGTFDNPSLLNATYTPGSDDISNGTVVLTITATAITPCSGSITDKMTLSIDPLPDTPDTPTGPVEVDIHFTSTSQYETQSATGAITYIWTLSPLTAGNIAGSGISSTVTWNAAFHGFAYVKVFAINNCGGMPSDSLKVFVYNSVGVGENYGDKMNVQIIPNPNRGSFKLSIADMENKLDIAIFSSDGGLIESHTLNNDGDIEMEFNLTDLPKGLYFIRLYNDRTNLIEKVIIQ